MLRIISLNLNGIRSAWSKNVLPWIVAQTPDIVCLQELKAQLPDLAPVMLAPDGMHAFYHAAEKKGYSGVGIWSRQRPDRVSEGFGHGEFDAEGRYIRADFGKLAVISLYLPSGSSSPERQETKFRFLDAFLPLLVSPATQDRQPEVMELLRAIATGIPDHVLTGCLEGMMTRPDSRGLLAGLDLPALVIHGADDAVMPPGEARALALALPRGELLEVPDAGHTPTLEQPALVGDAITRFLTEQL